MSELDNVLLDAKAKLAPIKSQKIDLIAQAKERLLTAPAVPSEITQQFQNTFQESGDLVRNSNPDLQRIIQEQENVILREDGSISIRLHNGRVIDKVNPALVPELLAREQEKAKAIESGASKNSFINRTADLFHQGVNVATDIGTSGFEVGRELLDISTGDTGGAGTQQTLTGAVDRFNAAINASRHGANLGIDPDTRPITSKQLFAYNEVINQTNAGKSLNPALQKFSKSAVFNTISQLDNRVQKSNSTIADIQEIAESIKSIAPVDRTADISASLAFKRISENEGTLAAIKNTLKNDLGTLIGQGYSSIPYMLAFTAGGPVTQMAVLGGLSKAKSREMTDVFIQETGREPTTEEISRIEGWSAAATVAEKFGDMVAVGAINRIKLPRVLNIRRIMQGLLPNALQNVLSRPVVAGTLAATGLTTKAGQRAATALTGEATSGAITSTSEQLALSGEITDPSQIAFDALAEAVGTVGGLGGILAARELKESAKLAKNIVKDFNASKQATRETGQSTSSETSSLETLQDETSTKEPPVATPIEVSKFDKVIDDIREVLGDSTPEAIKIAFRKLSDLSKRELTEEQAAEHKKVLDEHIKNLKDLKDFDNSDNVLGSLKPIDQVSKEDLQELSVNQDTTEADKLFINSIIEAQELAEEIEADSTNVQKIDKTAPKSTTIQDFNNILNEIRGVPSDSTFGTAETKAARTDSLISQLSTQLSNVQNRLSAVIAASKFTPEAGAITAIRATKTNPEDPNDLTEEYSKPISLSEAQLLEEQEAEDTNSRIIRVDQNVPEQIELLNKEVEFGNKIVELANTHQNTSFAQTSAQQATAKRFAEESIKILESQTPLIISKPKTELKVEDIKEPAKSKTKESSEITKESKPKSLAQEFVNPTVFGDPKDPAVINRKLWENKKIEVTNENGSTEKVNAGDLWDTLHKDLKMADDLIRCVKG